MGVSTEIDNEYGKTTNKSKEGKLYINVSTIKQSQFKENMDFEFVQ